MVKRQRKEYQHQWFLDNRERAYSNMKAYRRRTRDFIRSLKTRCLECGYDKCKMALSFHHRDGATKDLKMGNLSGIGISKEKILVEIEKCDVLCANCHAEHHCEETC